MAPIKNPKIIVSPAIQTTRGTAKVSVYRDTKGDIYIRPVGAKLTKAEKQKKTAGAQINNV